MLRSFGSLALLLCVAGCGAQGKPTGTLSGTVTLDSQPVTAGEVHLFSSEKGAGARATLDPGGKFAVTEPLDTGTYKVYITAPAVMATGGPDGSPPPVTAKLAIPAKYLQLETTDLSVEVKEGDNEGVALVLK